METKEPIKSFSLIDSVITYMSTDEHTISEDPVVTAKMTKMISEIITEYNQNNPSKKFPYEWRVEPCYVTEIATLAIYPDDYENITDLFQTKKVVFGYNPMTEISFNGDRWTFPSELNILGETYYKRDLYRSDEEVQAGLAHELMHGVNGDIHSPIIQLKYLIPQFLTVTVPIVLSIKTRKIRYLSLMLPSPFLANYKNISNHQIEHTADLTAVQQFPRFKKPMINSFKKMDDNTSLIKVKDIPFLLCVISLVFGSFFGGYASSHPTGKERISHINKHT